VGDAAAVVPVMTPVEVLNDKPEGNAGLIDHVTTGPPVFAGDHVLIVVPTT